jgi:hypothetical protein
VHVDLQGLFVMVFMFASHGFSCDLGAV